MIVPASGRYTPTRPHEIVRESRRDPATTATIRAEHGFSAEEWSGLNRRFDAGEMRVTRLQDVRRAA